MFDYLVVGLRFSGSVLAERIATILNKKVLIVDKRPHICGNAYDYYNEYGILVHKYGPHWFHTNDKNVFEYLSNFTEWRYHSHRVKTFVDGLLLPIPINMDTLNGLYDLTLQSPDVISRSFDIYRKFISGLKQQIVKVLIKEDLDSSEVTGIQ